MNIYKRGFTLVEVMITIVIIGILSSIAIIQYQVHVARSQSSRIVYELSDFRQTVEICLSEGKTNVGINVGECIPNSTASNLIRGGSQIGVILPNNTGVAQFSNPLTLNATITADISVSVAPPLQNKKIRLQRDINGNWKCISSILEKYLPANCSYDRSL